jgi:hemerythrin-like domain-containing protein
VSEGNVEVHATTEIDASEVMAILRQDHRRLGAVLEGVERELVGSHRHLQALRADSLRHGRVVAMLRFLSEYAERVHHPLENRLFDRLIEKGLTPCERRVVFVILAQHEEILGDLASLQAALRGLQAVPSQADAAALKARTERYLEAQRRHLNFEDSQLLPLIWARLTAHDWRDMEQDLAAQMDAIAVLCEREFLPAFHAILEAA